MQRDIQIIRATQRIKSIDPINFMGLFIKKRKILHVCIFPRAYNVVFIYIFTLFIKYIHLCFNAHVVVVVVGGGLRFWQIVYVYNI